MAMSLNYSGLCVVQRSAMSANQSEVLLEKTHCPYLEQVYFSRVYIAFLLFAF